MNQKKQKETLMKLLEEITKIPNAERCAICELPNKGTRAVCSKCMRERDAEYLIAHGVTVAEE